MTIDSINAKTVRQVSDSDLVRTHNRIHEMWNLASKESREKLRKKHGDLVHEMLRRNIQHNSPLPIAKEYAPEYYEEFTQLTSSTVTNMGAILSRVPSGACLELGGGIGTAARVLANSGREVLVVDLSQDAVDRCRSTGVDVEKADALEFLKKVADDSVDCVYSMHLLEHIDDPGALLKECIRVSRGAVLHVVPLGSRGDLAPKHTWRTAGDLRDALVGVECAKSITHLADNCVLLEVHEGLPDFLGAADDHTLVRGFVSVVGSAASKGGSDSDIDLLFRQRNRDESMEIVVSKSLSPGGRKRAHYIYNETGQHGDALPLYDLVLRACDPLKVERAMKALAPGRYFKTPKPHGTVYIHDRSTDDIKALLGEWPGRMLEQDGALQVECKDNGWRSTVHFDGRQFKLFFEEARKNHSDRFPGIRDDLRAIGKSVIFDCDLGAIGSDGRPLPSADLGEFYSTKVIPNTYDGTAGKSRLTVTAFDILYYDGKDLTSMPFKERRELLLKVALSSDLQVIRPSEGKATARRKFVDTVRRMAARPGSEGVVIKRLGKPYLIGEEIAPSWFKVKNVVTTRFVVTGVSPSGENAYSHKVACKATESDDLIELGGAMNAKTRYPKGTVVWCDVEEIIPIWNSGRSRWEAQMVICFTRKKADEGVMTVSQVISRAERAGVLQATPPVRAKLREDKLVKAVGGGAGASNGDEGVVGVEGNLDFRPGDSGWGVLQEHGVGLSDEEAKAFKQGLNRGTWALHTDFRMQRTSPKKDSYWEGGELFTPGNNRKANKLLRYTPGTHIRMNFKVPRKAGRTGKPPYVVRGPLGWMKIGERGVELFPPGAAGALANTWGVMRRIDKFKWIAGTQDDHYKEFKIAFSGPAARSSGRWIFAFAPVGPGKGRAWMAMRPGEQEMDAEREKGGKVVLQTPAGE